MAFQYDYDEFGYKQVLIYSAEPLHILEENYILETHLETCHSISCNHRIYNDPYQVLVQCITKKCLLSQAKPACLVSKMTALLLASTII